jgi:MoaD family protein
MKVHLKVFLPALAELMGGKELELQFAGDTVGELLDQLIRQYGRRAERELYDETGGLDPMVQVLVNGEQWITRECLGTELQEGDQVVLLMMMAGG